MITSLCPFHVIHKITFTRIWLWLWDWYLIPHFQFFTHKLTKPHIIFSFVFPIIPHAIHALPSNNFLFLLLLLSPSLQYSFFSFLIFFSIHTTVKTTTYCFINCFVTCALSVKNISEIFYIHSFFKLIIIILVHPIFKYLLWKIKHNNVSFKYEDGNSDEKEGDDDGNMNAEVVWLSWIEFREENITQTRERQNHTNEISRLRPQYSISLQNRHFLSISYYFWSHPFNLFPCIFSIFFSIFIMLFLISSYYIKFFQFLFYFI